MFAAQKRIKGLEWFAWTIFLGLVIGFFSSFLSWFLNLVEAFFLGWVESANQPVAQMVLPNRRFFSIFIGSLIAAFVWYSLARKKKKLPSVSESVAGNEATPSWQMIHILTQIFYVGTGGSVGREVAPRELGALLAQQFGARAKKFGLSNLTEEDKQLLTASAASAGLAGIYLSPLTGLFFCLEILYRKRSLKAVGVSLGMSLLAAGIGAILRGSSPYYLIGYSATNWAHVDVLLAGILIGILTGFFGNWFRRGSRWAEKKRSTGIAVLWQLPLIGAATGLVAMLGFPEIMGNGRALAQTAINASSLALLPLLAGFILLKGGLTLLTLRSGAYGGVLTPAISMGAASGAIVGIILSLAFPDMTIWLCALAGGAGFLSASQKAPFMALFMIIEICQLPLQSIAPVGLAVLSSYVTSHFYQKKWIK